MPRVLGKIVTPVDHQDNSKNNAIADEAVIVVQAEDAQVDEVQVDEVEAGDMIRATVLRTKEDPDEMHLNNSKKRNNLSNSRQKRRQQKLLQSSPVSLR